MRTNISKKKIVKKKIVTEKVKAHETSTSMPETTPAELSVGSDMALKVKVSCSSACDLRGKIVKVIAQDAVVKEMVIELTEFDGTANETEEFVVKVPLKPGEYTWTAVFPAQEKGGFLQEESSAPFSFIVKSHATSMSVWNVPSPIAFNSKFKIKVGVKCSANCRLTDKKIEICDHEGAKVATGTLGEVPWSGTGALYWAEVELEAPSTEGYYTWEAKFPKPDLKLPHEEASYPIRFATARPPDHMVTLEVIDKNKKIPIMNAEVILRSLKVSADASGMAIVSVPGPPYLASTDASGVAKVSVPKGNYEIDVSMHDYAAFARRIALAGDVTVKVELMYFPVHQD
jgi:hypothetical protein